VRAANPGVHLAERSPVGGADADHTIHVAKRYDGDVEDNTKKKIIIVP